MPPRPPACLVAHIDLARRILADQHGGKSGHESSLRFQLGRDRGDIGNEPIRARFSIDPFGHWYCVVDSFMFRHGRDVLVEMRAIGQPSERRVTILRPTSHVDRSGRHGF